MHSERVTFTGHDGSELSARLDLPDGQQLATALFVHCFSCTETMAAARRIAGRLTGAGIAVLRFDFTGIGHCEGEYENPGFTPNVADVVNAARYLESRGMAPGLLIGHSLGGAAVLKAAQEIAGVKAVATLGAPYSNAQVASLFTGGLDEAAGNDRVEVALGAQRFQLGRDFLTDIASDALKPAIHGMQAALMVMHAPLDSVVGIDNAQAIFTAALHPKSFVTLDNADHLITRAEDAEYAAGVITAWAARYLELARPAPPPGAPEGVVRVREADPAGFLQDINAGPRHHVLADEPVSYGGTDRGLSPYGFLSAGLGACTSMTIRMYARRKGWPLDAVRVDVTHDKLHAEDAATGKAEKIDSFTREIHLTGDLTEDQRQRLLEIADRCPVHKTLSHMSRIESRLA